MLSKSQCCSIIYHGNMHASWILKIKGLKVNFPDAIVITNLVMTIGNSIFLLIAPESFTSGKRLDKTSMIYIVLTISPLIVMGLEFLIQLEYLFQCLVTPYSV